MQANTRDLAAAGLFVAIGLFFMIDAALHLRFGRALNMGPGFFPVILGSILAGFGVAIGIGALRQPAGKIGPIPWRRIGLVLAAIIFFAVTVRGLGVAPAVFGAALLASRASEEMGWIGSVILSLCISVFCVGMFIMALNLPYPVFGPWLGR